MFPEYSINPLLPPRDLQNPKTHEMFPEYSIQPTATLKTSKTVSQKSIFLTILPQNLRFWPF